MDLRQRAVEAVRREVDALGEPDRDRLAQRRLEKCGQIGVRAVFAERSPGQRVEPAQRHQEDEFLPERHPDVGAEDALEAGRGAQIAQALAARG